MHSTEMKWKPFYEEKLSSDKEKQEGKNVGNRKKKKKLREKEKRNKNLLLTQCEVKSQWGVGINKPYFFFVLTFLPLSSLFSFLFFLYINHVSYFR